MAEINVRTQLIDRDELARFIPPKNFRLFKFFENLATDVSQTIPDAIGESISGPSVAGDENIVIFDGTTGTKAKDSGVNIVDVALLNSPNFTGIPTAPTAAPGNNTTQLATTAFVQGEVAAGVDGPAAATNNAIALFDGITGKLIKDSATLLTSLAPLASPALTGNPTAPNQTLGDNDTSIANTAFVQAAITNLSASAASFSAHNNGVAQSIPNAAWTKLTFSTEAFDVGSKFASSTWTPSARLVLLTACVSLPTVANKLISVSIYKNGALFKQGVMIPAGGTNFAQATVTCIDIPNGTDTYEAWAYQDTGAAQNTGGAAIATYFQGTTIQA